MVKYYDYFGKEALELGEKKLFLFDMDGTIYEENTLFDGTLDLLTEIKKSGGHYVFITNNSSKSVVDYIKKVQGLKIACDENNFFTSAQATILYIKNRGLKDKLIYCQGTESLVKELVDAGLNVTTDVNYNAEVILVGFDTELTSQKIRNTCEMLSVKKEDLYIATNPDLACPVSFGFIPDCGSICGMINNATGRVPTYIGKPEPTMVRIVAEKFGIPDKDICVIGDRLYTDVATGLNAGVTSIAVLTGEATEFDIKKGNIKPTYTFQSVNEMYECIRQVHDGIDTKELISERSVRLNQDIQECNRIIGSGCEDELIEELKLRYSYYDVSGSNIEILQNIKKQLLYAARML